MEEDCGWWEGWGSATIRAVTDASCSGEELRAGTEAANSARAPGAGVEAEGFGHKQRWKVLFTTRLYIVGKDQHYLPEIKKMNKQIQTCLCPKYCNNRLRTVLSV